MTDHAPFLSSDAFNSLLEVSEGDAPQLHWERLVGLGYAVRRLGELGLTSSGMRRLAMGKWNFLASKTASLRDLAYPAFTVSHRIICGVDRAIGWGTDCNKWIAIW